MIERTGSNKINQSEVDWVIGPAGQPTGPPWRLETVGVFRRDHHLLDECGQSTQALVPHLLRFLKIRRRTPLEKFGLVLLGKPAQNNYWNMPGGGLFFQNFKHFRSRHF